MKALLVLVLFLSSLAFADDYRHMVSVGTGGLGWSGAVEKMETGSKSPFSDVDYIFHNLSLNYAYRLNERFQLGGFFHNSTSEYRFNTPSSKPRTEVHTETIGIFGLYNFSDTISSAWYTGLSVAHYRRADETSHNISEAEDKAPFELDDTGEIYEIVAGKRFRLLKWNIDHITFAPQISVYVKTHGKDFDDQDIDNGYGITIQPIRFDVLF